MFSFINVIPKEDLCEHQLGFACDCKPVTKFIEQKVIIEHNSWDERETRHPDGGQWVVLLDGYKPQPLH
jgi:hypothetical protein